MLTHVLAMNSLENLSINLNLNFCKDVFTILRPTYENLKRQVFGHKNAHFV